MRSPWKTYAKHIHIDASTMLEMVGRSLLPASYEYLSRVSTRGRLRGAERLRLRQRQGAGGKTVRHHRQDRGRDGGAAPRAACAGHCAFGLKKARARTPAARCAQHEMAALREAADELEWSLCPRRTGPCRITASCCSTCKARCSRLLCAKIILQTQNGPVPGGCKPRDRAFSLFRRVSVQHTPQRKAAAPARHFPKAQLFV